MLKNYYEMYIPLLAYLKISFYIVYSDMFNIWLMKTTLRIKPLHGRILPELNRQMPDK